MTARRLQRANTRNQLSKQLCFGRETGADFLERLVRQKVTLRQSGKRPGDARRNAAKASGLSCEIKKLPKFCRMKNTESPWKNVPIFCKSPKDQKTSNRESKNLSRTTRVTGTKSPKNTRPSRKVAKFFQRRLENGGVLSSLP